MPRADRKIVVELRISSVVPVVSNHGGYMGRRCLYCNAGGWESDSDYGYRYGSKDLRGNEIVHTRTCVLNQYIERDTGKLIPEGKK